MAAAATTSRLTDWKVPACCSRRSLSSPMVCCTRRSSTLRAVHLFDANCGLPLPASACQNALASPLPASHWQVLAEGALPCRSTPAANAKLELSQASLNGSQDLATASTSENEAGMDRRFKARDGRQVRGREAKGQAVGCTWIMDEQQETDQQLREKDIRNMRPVYDTSQLVSCRNTVANKMD